MEKKRENFKKADIILIISLLVLALLCAVLVYTLRKSGGVAVVYTNGVETGRYPLDRDTQVRLTGYKGGSNTLVIREGYADITDADCPDAICVHTRAIRYAGETIICLPHRVEVVIEGGRDSGVDVG